MDDDDETLQKRVLMIEHFINERLRTDLKKLSDHRDQLYDEMAEYLQLKNALLKLQETGATASELKTQVDLGCDVYVQARVSDPSKVFVGVGYGFFTELTIDEALSFIEKKVDFLNKRAEACTKDCCKLKARIKVLLQGLGAVQGLGDADERRPHRFIM